VAAEEAGRVSAYYRRKSTGNAAPCPTSATRAQQNGNGSQGANFTAGGCELFANEAREAGDSGRETEALWDSRHSPPDTWTAGRMMGADLNILSQFCGAIPNLLLPAAFESSN